MCIKFSLAAGNVVLPVVVVANRNKSNRMPMHRTHTYICTCKHIQTYKRMYTCMYVCVY